MLVLSTLDRITNLLKKQNKKQKELTDYLGITKNAFTDWKNGRIKSYNKYIPQIAEFLNVSTDYLLGNAIDTKGVLIPVLGRVVAGIPIDAIEEILDYEEITQEMANSGEFFALKIKGDSMTPRIQENDVVIVRKQSQVDNGSIAIVLINGNEATCKKVQYNEKGVALISYNSSYTPMFYTKEECLTLPVTIIGKVVELRAKF